MKNRSRAAIALAVGCALALGPGLAALGAGSTIINGSFESDAPGSTSVTGWSAVTDLIDLGETSLAGCATVDTSDYANLRDYDGEAEPSWNLEGAPVPDFPDAWYVYTAAGQPVTILGDALVYAFGIFGLEVLSAGAPIEEPPVEEPVTEEPVTEEPVTEEPVTEEPVTEEPVTEEPVTEEPVTEEPVTEEPTTTEPTPIEEPTTTEPTPTEEPTEEPGVFIPGSVSYDYIPQDAWSAAQEEAFLAAYAASIADPEVRQDDAEGVSLDASTVTVVDGAAVGRAGNVLELFSDLDGEDSGAEGYVAHGPAVYSDEFTVGTGREISVDWKAVNESDDFHVFGYLLNTDTCAQIEVIDATGEEQDWTTTSVEIPAAGTYRFVFVSGSYDQSWGGAAGAYMYIDNIVQTASFDGPGIDLALSAGVGDFLPGSEVQLAGGDLVDNSEWTAVLRSTPVLLAEGLTDGNGEFLEFARLPDEIEPGAHTITLTGQGPSGTLAEVAYITVGEDGTLLYLSFSGPESGDEEPGAPTAPGAPAKPESPVLAHTGAAEMIPFAVLASVLLVAGAGGLMLGRRRRGAHSR